MTLPSRSLAVAVAFVVSATAAADVPKPPDPNRGGFRQSVFQMRSGNIRVKDEPKHREALKIVAEWLAFTLCQPPFNGEQTPPGVTIGIGQDSPTFLMGEAETLSNIYSGTTAKPGQEQLEFADEFGKAIAAAVKVVLDNSTKPIERINAIRLMSVAARVPAPSLADPLMAVVTNPKASDAEKLYAFQGLRNLLDQSDVNDATRHVFGGAVGNPKLSEIGMALNNYVMQKRSPKDEKEKAVIEFVRRDAVAALARFKEGTLRKANRDLLFRPAWALARIMEQDPGVYPPFTFQEQIEAASGFAQMKIDPDLNLDVAAYFMAKTLVTAAGVANLDNERASSTSTLPLVQWKVLAARWSYALSVWRENAKAIPAARNPIAVREVANAGIGMLTELEKNGVSAQTAAGVRDLTAWATNNPPKAWAEMKSAILLKDDPQSILPFPAPAAPVADPKLKTPDPKVAPKVDPKAPPPKK